MSIPDVRLERREQTVLYGVGTKANDKTVSKDIQRLSATFHKLSKTRNGSILPFYVLSHDYAQGRFDLFIGSLYPHEKLERFIVPGGEYARLTVNPILGLFWGAAIGRAKRFFYTEWLPQSKYCARNLEYELHTEKATGRHPAIDILFAVSDKG